MQIHACKQSNIDVINEVIRIRAGVFLTMTWEGCRIHSLNFRSIAIYILLYVLCIMFWLVVTLASFLPQHQMPGRARIRLSLI